MELSHASPADQQEFLQNVRMHLPPTEGVRVQPIHGDDGSVKTVMQFVRSGFPSFPEMAD
jgi:hypothetical protein